MSIRVLIVDDNERERVVLRYVLEQISDVDIVGEAISGLEALLICQEKKVDLVFLDVNMPEMDGFEIAEKLLELKDKPLFAFVTSHREFAFKAYDLGALDYIIKPIEKVRIEKTINRVKYQMAHEQVIDEKVKTKLKERIDFMLKRYKDHENYSNKLPIRAKGKIILLNQEDIIYCESQGKKVFIATLDEGHLCNYTLNELEKRLDSIVFFRAHQAFIVNLNYIKEIVNFGEGTYLLNLTFHTKKNIILSRSRARLLRQKMGIK